MTTLIAFGLALTGPQYDIKLMQGWALHIRRELSGPELDKALTLLSAQLQEIVRVVPAPAVEQLRKVPLWFSPEYKGLPPRAEFHPDSGWLKKNQRDPDMAQGIEFTNVRIFEEECRRMPNFALHELAHAYQFRVLPKGFENPEIKEAYAKAKASGKYDRVERVRGDGSKSQDRAYALTNPMEYFAETTESYFSRNDFQPYTGAELSQDDPGGFALIRRQWGVPEISAPPAWLTKNGFYGKYFDAHGFPVLASAKVNDFALKEAGWLIDLMLAKRPDVRAAMVTGGSRMVVMAWNELTTDIPEYAGFQPKDFWDARARGLGGSVTDPVCSCAEENVLGYPGDPYVKECIVIHEFAHSIHLRGVNKVDSTFQKRLSETYRAAMKKELWKGKYASTNAAEYFAEGVQSWFDNNRENDADHNHVNTRAELLDYDPGLAALCKEVFGDTELKYTKPVTRLTGHLAGYDPGTAPTFVWPKKLDAVRAQIKKDAENRKGNGGG